MIGILLALQVNNWNEARKDQRTLTNILQNIAADMRSDNLNIKEIMEYAEEENKRIKSFLDHEDYSGFTRDSLEQSLVVYSYNTGWRRSGFDNLRDSGITEFGAYSEVVKRIKDYYEYWIPNIIATENEFVETVARSNDFWRFEETSYEFSYAKGLHSHQSDEEAMTILTTMVKSPIPRKILKTNYFYSEYLIGAYESYLVGIDGMVKEIEDALLEAG
jgi:hypothetical protein